MQPSSFFFVIRCGGGGGVFGSGSGSKFNCAARVGSGRVGSDDLGYGPGSGFSFEPVQNSSENNISYLSETFIFAYYMKNIRYEIC